MTDHAALRQEIQDGSIWAKVSSGRYWRVRLNGKTQLWARDKARFRIPVKAGLSLCGEITHETVIGECDSNEMFINSHSDPNTIKRA